MKTMAYATPKRSDKYRSYRYSPKKQTPHRYSPEKQYKHLSQVKNPIITKEERLKLIKERHMLMKKERESIEKELKMSKLEKELEKELEEDKINEEEPD